jgi:hypothetical protein
MGLGIAISAPGGLFSLSAMHAPLRFLSIDSILCESCSVICMKHTRSLTTDASGIQAYLIVDVVTDACLHSNSCDSAMRYDSRHAREAAAKGTLTSSAVWLSKYTGMRAISPMSPRYSLIGPASVNAPRETVSNAIALDVQGK